jgi:hypothetical protein
MSEHRTILQRALERAGWIGRPPERTVLFFGVDESVYETVAAVIAALRKRYGRLQFVFAGRSPAMRAALAERWPHALVLPPPWGNPASALLFLLTTRARLIIALHSLGHLDRTLGRRAYYLGIPIVVLDAVESTAASRRREDPWLLSRADLFLPRDAAAAAALRLRRVPAERIQLQETPAQDAEARGAGIVEAMAPLVGRRPPVRRASQRAIVAALGSPRLRRLFAFRAQRIESLEAFRQALGDPRTIMCLGNGPSSESPALEDMAYDSLFRVNHRWRTRGFLTDPHVVFTGGKRTLFTLKGPIFAFQTWKSEAHLVTHQIFNPFCGRMRYVTLEHLGVLPALDEGGRRPSNGAAPSPCSPPSSSWRASTSSSIRRGAIRATTRRRTPMCPRMTATTSSNSSCGCSKPIAASWL